jgi:PAS domain S-box-containing protein
LSPARIAWIYVIVSILWISGSDRIVNRIGDAHLRLLLSTGKGIGFVLVTSLMMYFLVRRLVYQTRRAQDSLASSEAEFRMLIEATTEGVCRLAADGRIVFANPRMAELLQCGAGELVGKPFMPFLDAADSLAFAGQVERWRQGDTGQRDFRFRGAKGAEIWAIVSGTAMAGNAGCFLLVMDVTERQKLQEQLHHSQKLETVGRLAGGIAHDFNNLLCVIMGYAAMLQGRSVTPAASGEYVASILRASETAAVLVRQLLTFSRKQQFTEAIVDLNEAADSVGQMLPRLIGEEVKVIIRKEVLPVTVKTDPAQIQQLIMNLAINARDAMPHGGTLTIEISRLRKESGSGAEAVPAGEYAVLRVADTGFGMDAETKARIFEPFFTTKDVGKGTGLGLSMVYGIVKRSGGQIAVTSAPGQGTSFTMHFPLVEAAPLQPVEPQRMEAAAARGHGTILLVEDGEELRSLTRQILTEEGYNVIEAVDGKEALALAETRLGKIDLLLTDVVMPRMGGVQLAEALTALKPNLKVIFISGYACDAIAQFPQLKSATLAKPITPNALIAAVGDILERPGL